MYLKDNKTRDYLCINILGSTIYNLTNKYKMMRLGKI